MNRFHATVATGFILTLGAGAALGCLWCQKRAGSANATYLQRLIDEYDLRPDQVERIRGHLEQEQADVDAVLMTVEGQVRVRIQEARKAAEDAIRAALDDEQRGKFDRARRGE